MDSLNVYGVSWKKYRALVPKEVRSSWHTDSRDDYYAQCRPCRKYYLKRDLWEFPHDKAGYPLCPNCLKKLSLKFSKNNKGNGNDNVKKYIQKKLEVRGE